jgi:predicted site-specific integrase-resolvase
MEILNVTRMTLLSWEEKGKLHPVRTPGVEDVISKKK